MSSFFYVEEQPQYFVGQPLKKIVFKIVNERNEVVRSEVVHKGLYNNEGNKFFDDAMRIQLKIHHYYGTFFVQLDPNSRTYQVGEYFEFIDVYAINLGRPDGLSYSTSLLKPIRAEVYGHNIFGQTDVLLNPDDQSVPVDSDYKRMWTSPEIWDVPFKCVDYIKLYYNDKLIDRIDIPTNSLYGSPPRCDTYLEPSYTADYEGDLI